MEGQEGCENGERGRILRSPKLHRVAFNFTQFYKDDKMETKQGKKEAHMMLGLQGTLQML